MGEKEIKDKIIKCNQDLEMKLKEIKDTEMLVRIKKIEYKKIKNNIETLKLELEEIRLSKIDEIKEQKQKQRLEKRQESMSKAMIKKYNYGDIKNPILKEHLYNRYFSTEKETIGCFEDDVAYAQKYAQRHKEA